MALTIAGGAPGLYGMAYSQAKNA